MFNIFDVRKRANAERTAPTRRAWGAEVIVTTASIAAFDGQIGQAHTEHRVGCRRHDLADRSRAVTLGYTREAIAPGLFDTRCSPMLPTRPAPH